MEDDGLSFLAAHQITEVYGHNRQPKDKNYNLISVLYQSSDNAESLKTFIQDAEAEGDQELVEFFGGILENNLRAAQRAKEMLVPRFQSEQE